MLWLILLPMIFSVLFFTWAMCRASSLAESDDERSFQEWLQRKGVISDESQ